MQGRTVVLVFVAILALAAAIVVAYKVQESGQPPIAMRFEPLPTGTNATALDYKPVHSGYYLEDHLRTCIDHGASRETSRLRVEAMRDLLVQLTQRPGPVWNVTWDGHPIQVTLQDPAVPA